MSGSPVAASRPLSPWQILIALFAIGGACLGYGLRFCHGQSSAASAEAIATTIEDKTDFSSRLVKAALERTKQEIRYDPAYVVLEYPGGDVPADTGVCTDVVVRCYRALGIDLQKLVHEDMRQHFSRYPKNWGLSRPDKNIDHRRVPNLQVFFSRHGESIPVSKDVEDYLPGDLVAWDLNGRSLWHIGIVVAEDTIVHNIGGGPVLERGIFSWEVVGHYRFQPASAGE